MSTTISSAKMGSWPTIYSIRRCNGIWSERHGPRIKNPAPPLSTTRLCARSKAFPWATRHPFASRKGTRTRALCLPGTKRERSMRMLAGPDATTRVEPRRAFFHPLQNSQHRNQYYPHTPPPARRDVSRPTGFSAMARPPDQISSQRGSCGVDFKNQTRPAPPKPCH